MRGMRRAAESLLSTYLDLFPCVAIIGVRQCGKTTLLNRLSQEWTTFDLERRADFEHVSRDPDLFFKLNPDHVAIDEAQLLPEVFAALRVAIDDQRQVPGRFVITGSSSPSLLKSISESLAGRIGIIELSPFSWEEVTETLGRDSFVRRLRDPGTEPWDLVGGLRPRGDLDLAHELWFHGGYPEPWLKEDPRFRQAWTDQYIQTYLLHDVKRLFPRLDEIRFRRFLELLGGLSGRILNYAEVARALDVSQPTVRDYFEIAHGTFVWRQIPAHTKNTQKRVVKHPRGYLRDSGLLHALLRVPDQRAMLSHPQMGSSWEGMVVEELLRQLDGEGMSYEASYYRTGGGAEVDLIVRTSFGMVAIEIKHSSTVHHRELRSLKSFVDEQDARLGVVVNNDSKPRLYADRIVGLPFTHL